MKPVANSALLHFQVVFLAAFFWNWQLFDTYMVVVHVDAETYNLVFCLVPAIWVFPKIGVPQNGWFIMENPSTH